MTTTTRTHRRIGRPSLNKGMPHRYDNEEEYFQERAARIEAGTWNYGTRIGPRS